MLKLHQFPPAPKDWGVPNGSPFCSKVETYLRMTGTPFENVVVPDPRKMPKGKLPVLEDNGKMIPDSSAIIAHLKATLGDKLDAHLSAGDQAVGHAMRRALEEHLYWVMMYSRWVYEPGWQQVKPIFFGFLPAIARAFLPEMIRRKQRAALLAHGVGRHSEAEIWELGRADLTMVSELLGDKQYILGDQPSSFDATVYPFAAALTLMPLETPITKIAGGFPNLVAYSKRMRDKYYPAS